MRVRDWVLGAGAALAVGAWAADAVPVQAFFEKPAISEAEISPTGRHVAVVSRNAQGRNQLVVIDTATFKPFVAAASPSLDVSDVNWASDKRLVYSLGDPDRSFSEYVYSLGVYAVDYDGREHRDLTGTSVSPTTQVRFGYFPQLLDTSWMQDSDAVFVGFPQTDSHGELDYMQARRIDSRTGRATKVDGPPRASDWVFGPGDVPQFASSREGQGKGSVYHFDAKTGSWSKVEEYDWVQGEGGFTVIGWADENTAYALRRAKGTDFEALYTYDIKARTFSAEPVVSAKGFDLRASLVRSRDKIIGLRYTTDAQTTVWLDPEMKKVQAQVDALLPATVNRISVPLRAEVPVVLVYAYSDADPGQYLIYDTQAKKLVQIGQVRPAIDAKRMAHVDFVRLQARDGLDLPAWVTVPGDGRKGPRPMVVLVHGGPWVRGGHWRWSDEAQFLASRGYVVLEPEFRGSTGYGLSHVKASWKQWGLKMQDDVADATRWAIAKGYADPKRICIAGASYGGYATLMGLVNDPDLYKCGVNWVGVTDIDLMYSVHWSDMNTEYTSFGMPVMVADRQKDAAQIKATSPIQQAARIKQPLLMAYGGEDRRVPLEHGTAFRDAVMKTNPNVEWLVYPDEGHGWRQVKNQVDWWTRVEKFLAKNIGN